MPLSRQQISAIAHTDHPIACPFSDARVHQLLELLPEQGRVLDIGCGGGEWIGRLLALHPALTASGIDTSSTAIARARARLVELARPRVLVLDEATSNVDMQSEARIERALDYALQGRTAIIIAHRLATARRAHRIAVIADGRVAELGTHEELLERGGAYRAMFDTWTRGATRTTA